MEKSLDITFLLTKVNTNNPMFLITEDTLANKKIFNLDFNLTKMLLSIRFKTMKHQTKLISKREQANARGNEKTFF